MRKEPIFFRLSELNIDALSERLSELYFVVRRKRRDPAFWRRYYLCSPFGNNILIIASRGEEVVGMYGLLNVLLSVQGDRSKVGLMTDLYINPEDKSWFCYRGLVEESIAEAQKENLEFRFGIAPAKATNLYGRLGVTSLGLLPVYLGFLPLLGFGRRKIAVPDLEIRSLENFNSDFDELGDNIAGTSSIAIVKNAAYLNWKYGKFSGSQLVRLAAYRGNRLEGLAVFCYNNFLFGNFLLELIALDDNPEIVKILLYFTLEAMREKNIGYVTASFPDGTQSSGALKEFGFKPWGSRIWHYPELVVAGTAKKAHQGLGKSDWDFSLGDWAIF